MSVNLRIGADFRDFFQKVDDAKAKMKKLGGQMQLVGGAATLGLTLPLGLMAKKAIDASGELDTLYKDFGRLKDEALAGLGKEIIKTFNVKENMEKFKTFLEGVMTAFANLNPKVKKAVLIFAAVLAAIGPVTMAIGTLIKILPALIAGFQVLLGPVGLVIAGIAALATAFIYVKENLGAFSDFFYNAWVKIKNNLIENIKGISTPIIKLLELVGKEDLAKGFIESLDKMKGEVRENAREFGTLKEAIKNTFSGIKDKLFTGDSIFKLDAEKTKEGVNKALVEPIKNAYLELKSVGKDFEILGKEIGQNIPKGIAEGLQNNVATIIEPVMQFAEASKQLLISAQEDMATAIGEGLGSMMAGGTWKDFGSSILQSVGSFLGSLGKMLITYAIAEAALFESLKNPALWPVALAAGIALVAASSAISGLMSKGPGGGGSYSSPSYGGSSGGGVGYNTDNLVMDVEISGRKMILVQQRESRFSR